MMKGKSEENSAIQATFVLRATELLCRRQQRERKSFSFVLFFITLGVWLWCFLVLRVVPSLFRQLNEPAFGGAGIIARTYFRCHWEIDKKWQKPFPSSRRPVSLNRASNWFGFFLFFCITSTMHWMGSLVPSRVEREKIYFHSRDVSTFKMLFYASIDSPRKWMKQHFTCCHLGMHCAAFYERSGPSVAQKGIENCLRRRFLGIILAFRDPFRHLQSLNQFNGVSVSLRYANLTFTRSLCGGCCFATIWCTRRIAAHSQSGMRESRKIFI